MLTRNLRFAVGQIQQRLKDQLTKSFKPTLLNITNQSHLHSRGRESHFNLLIVAQRFKGLSKLQQHKLIYAQLGPLMQQIHALTIRCHGEEPNSPEKQGSPDCVHQN